MLAGPAETKPDRVTLLIPESQEKNLALLKPLTLSTKPITLGDDVRVGENLTVEVEVLPPPGIGNAATSPATVSVTFKVGQRTDSKTFTVAVEIQTPRSWLTKGTWSKIRTSVQTG